MKFELKFDPLLDLDPQIIEAHCVECATNDHIKNVLVMAPKDSTKFEIDYWGYPATPATRPPTHARVDWKIYDSDGTLKSEQSDTITQIEA